MKTLQERFLEYVKIDTTPDETSSSCPSSKIQFNLGNLLVEECLEIGLKNVHIDDKGYVYAFLPKNAENFYNIGFIAHMDTSPDASGNNVQPLVISNYNGADIVRTGPTLSASAFPKLKNYVSQTIITSDGTTLLGADDKAGIAEILTAMEFLIKNPSIKHGNISVCFTPDEEIGKGADFFNVEKFNCDFAYTIDGGEIGELEYENFNAARAKIKIEGINVHPGTAKNLMKNGALIGTELASMLPEKETPAHTENYEGFFHLVSINGSGGNCELNYIIRDFNKDSFQKRKDLITEIVDKLNQKYGNIISLNLYDEYFNMKEKIEPSMHIINIAKKSMEDVGITPIIKPIRGGTDGARLSFMGLPCPNIFAGGHNFHGVYEFIPLESMEKCVELIVKISENSKLGVAFI